MCYQDGGLLDREFRKDEVPLLLQLDCVCSVRNPCSLGFRVQGLGSRVAGLGFRVQGSGFRVKGLGFRIEGSGFRV